MPLFYKPKTVNLILMSFMTTKSKIFSVLFVAFILAALVRTFVIEGLIVVGESMEPTIQSGDYIFINKMAYSNRNGPERGDIIVAYSRGKDAKKIVKRVIGLPGERFAVEEGAVVIRAKRLDPGERIPEAYLKGTTTPSVGITLINLDPQEYFALGDNREVSIDSRELGPVDLWEIKGKVFLSFSLKNLRFKKI